MLGSFLGDQVKDSESVLQTCIVSVYMARDTRRSTRLTQPLVRRNGSLQPAGWDEALEVTAAAFARAKENRPELSFGMFSCSKTTNELNYAVQKFVRSIIGSNNIDSCNRT